MPSFTPSSSRILLATAVVGEVKTGSTFYAGSATLKTGSGTQTLNPANENVPAGYYALTTLSAVDAQLAAANIKSGIVIFGFTGTHKGLEEEATEASVAMFQAYVCLHGTIATPQGINDNNTAVSAATNALNAYAIVHYGDLVKIKRWRQFGVATNNGDGEWKIQYRDVVNDVWVDWVTGIPTRIGNWSALATEAEVVTVAIKLIATAIDSENYSRIGELEVIF